MTIHFLLQTFFRLIDQKIRHEFLSISIDTSLTPFYHEGFTQSLSGRIYLGDILSNKVSIREIKERKTKLSVGRLDF